MQTAPVLKDLMLVGGGHSHVAVLKAFGMQPLRGVRITLVSRNTQTPYSGMLPGLVAGYYSIDQAHIDLVPLCRFAGARFIKDEVIGVDPEARTVLLANRPPISYDLLSINSGSTPSLRAISGDVAAVIPVKPIDRFLAHWERLLERATQRDKTTRIAVIGGGAGGVELSLAVQRRLASLDVKASIELLTDQAEILTTHQPKVRARLRRILAERGIAVHPDNRVIEARAGSIHTSAGNEFSFNELLWVTNAAAPAWLAESGLAVDGDGFLLIDRFLRSTSHREIFGAGDVAAVRDDPRPKAGVFAVRQGGPLAHNLRRVLLKRPLLAYRAQRRFLSLIGTGSSYAIASRGRWSAEGHWVWRWKDWLDRRFMTRFQNLPEMSEVPVGEPAKELGADPQRDGHDDGMRCGGCGAKIGAEILTSALAELKPVQREDVIVGLNAPDDAALVSVPADKLSVLSVDAFRPMIDDPYLFGQITANHCLNDLFAIGAAAQTAMTIVTLPVWPDEKLSEELKQMLAGALKVFAAEGAALVGGHTSEGVELSLGFSVTGLIDRGAALLKKGLKPGDVLILTKPVGTGAIFAADMRAKARGVWVDAALASMLQSNAAASECLRAHGTRACTDVTGFGLFGHLLEMIGEDSLSLDLDLDALPVLQGALESMRRGIASSLQAQNERAARRARLAADLTSHPHYPLLFDPQTAGGLLAALPVQEADICVRELKALGYLHSAVIGTVEKSATPGRVEIAARQSLQQL